MQGNDTDNQVDLDGYRKNVGIIVCNGNHQVLWARRTRHDGWQFPQGGIRPDESPKSAAYRELYEEVGLQARDVRLLGHTEKWLRYDVPARKGGRSLPFRGQKQLWFLFRLISDESRIRLDVSLHPEFDRWKWIEYWNPLDQIIAFKLEVYREALTQLESFLDNSRKRGNPPGNRPVAI